MNYYLINNKIMKGKKMPLHVYSDHPNWYDSKMYLNSKDYLDWLSSLQPCEINSYESMLINKYLLQNGFVLNNNPNPIDVTDIVEEKIESYCKKCNKTSEICECSFNSDNHANKNTHLKSIIYFKQPTEKQVESEIEAVEFAKWIQSEKWVYNKGLYYKGLSEQIIVTTKQLYEIFKNRKP